MSMTDATIGWITIGTAVIWAGKGISALIGSRRAAAPLGFRERSQKWQWFTLAAWQVISGIWFITGPSSRRAVFWWLMAGFVVLLAWIIVTDVQPWMRSRLTSSSSHDPS